MQKVLYIVRFLKNFEALDLNFLWVTSQLGQIQVFWVTSSGPRPQSQEENFCFFF